MGFLVGFFKWVLGEKTRWVFSGRVGFFKRCWWPWKIDWSVLAVLQWHIDYVFSTLNGKLFDKIQNKKWDNIDKCHNDNNWQLSNLGSSGVEGGFGRPSGGTLDSTRNGSQRTRKSYTSDLNCMAASKFLLPIQHHGHMTSETTSIFIHGFESILNTEIWDMSIIETSTLFFFTDGLHDKTKLKRSCFASKLLDEISNSVF